MKIALIIAWNFEQLDGSTLRFYFTLKELIKRRHDVTVIHASREAAAYTKKIFGCTSCHVNVSISRWDGIARKIFNYMLFVVRARRLLKRRAFDAVYSISLINNMVGIAVQAPRKTVLYVDFMSLYYRYRNRGPLGWFLYRVAAFLERYTIRRADRTVVITEHLKQLIDRQFHEKITVIPDGVDTQMFQSGTGPGNIRHTYGIAQDAPVIGYQGGIEPHDGLQFLVYASPFIIRENSLVRFLVAGRGSYLGKIRSDIKGLGMEPYWIFTGWVENNKIPLMIAASDVNVVPIPNDPCTAPLITYRLLESMASGVIIVANDLPGMREVADDTMVYFTHIENPERFAASLMLALKVHADDKKIRAAACRKRVEGLDWRIIAQREVDLLEI